MEPINTTRKIGALGEDIACKWLIKHGFLVVERNYLRKWGEIDIVATKDKNLHFIEVKSGNITSHSSSRYRLEENVHNLKIRRLKRVIQTYMAEKHINVATQFYFHIITVALNTTTRKARVNLLENIVL